MDESNDERIQFVGGFFHVREPVIPFGAADERKKWLVWFNADVDFDGVVIGSGATRELAIADARETLSGALAALNFAPTQFTTADGRAIAPGLRVRVISERFESIVGFPATDANGMVRVALHKGYMFVRPDDLGIPLYSERL